MDFWEQFAINAASSVIRTFVKNPLSAAKFRSVFQHIYDDLGTILGALPPTPPVAN